MTIPFDISFLQTTGSGKIALCRLPGSTSLIQDDVQKLVDLNPACIVSLTPIQELNEKGGIALPMLLQRHEILWFHFPIDDYSFPTKNQNESWNNLAKKLHAFLDDGKTVVFHCLAGIGRSGTIALRLMIERGEDHTAALKRMREVRPGAVETPQQLAWATNYVSAK